MEDGTVDAEDTNYMSYSDINFTYDDDVGMFTFSEPEVAIIGIAYALVFIVGIIGNSFVIAVVARTPQMWSATHFFIANLAFADILVLMFCLPVNFIQNVFFGKWFQKKPCRLPLKTATTQFL